MEKIREILNIFWKEVWNIFSSFSFLVKKNKKDNKITFDKVSDFSELLFPNGKVIWNKIINLSNNNSFFINNINQKANKFYDLFIDLYDKLSIDKLFNREIENYYNNFQQVDFLKNNNIKGKELIVNIWGKVLTWKEERWNIISYDYWKTWKLLFYMYDNSKIYPLDIIKIDKKKENVRNVEDLKIEAWLLNNRQDIIDNIWKGIFFYPLVIMDINLYDIKIYLKEMYYFFHHMTFSLFFKENEKFKSLYKSMVVKTDQLVQNFRDDKEIRDNIKWIIKSREWYNMGKALQKIIPGNVDVTYYYTFISIKRNLYPCYVSIKDIVENDKQIIVNLDFQLSEAWWLSHNMILQIFKKIWWLEPKSFIYQNFEDYNVQKDISFLSYSDLLTMRNIVNWYNKLFNW